MEGREATKEGVRVTARTVTREKLGRWGGTGDRPLKVQGMRQGKGRLSGKGGEP